MSLVRCPHCRGQLLSSLIDSLAHILTCDVFSSTAGLPMIQSVRHSQLPSLPWD